jgi:HlyD family secretion protein
MTLPKPVATEAKDTANVVALPKQVVVRGAPVAPRQAWRDALWRFRYVPVAMGLIMLGGIIGLYFQPPGLRKVFEIFKLQPGGGTKTPIAVPVGTAATQAPKLAPPRQIVGLGKLIPRGDVTVLSPPYGSGDARIAAIRFAEGDIVEAGAILATLDNELQLKAAVDSASAIVRSREASLAQTNEATRASREEAKAALDKARATLANAEREFERTEGLFKRGVSTGVAADQKRTARDEATREVERLTATLSRYLNAKPDEQPDVIVAMRNLDSAKADLRRYEQEIEKAYIRAPTAGTILTIHVRPGEKPGTSGVLNMGDTAHMMAQIEVYQTQIGRVSLGDVVEVSAEALGAPLQGTVSRIGLEVSRQTVVDPSPAANTDARVAKVDVRLDPASSARAKRFTNLQVTGRITVQAQP